MSESRDNHPLEIKFDMFYSTVRNLDKTLWSICGKNCDLHSIKSNIDDVESLWNRFRVAYEDSLINVKSPGVKTKSSILMREEPGVDLSRDFADIKSKF